jgi:hypothetical protein
MSILCWIKHKWTPAKSFPESEYFNNWVVWRGYQCKRCNRKKLEKVDTYTKSVYADNLAFDWLNSDIEKKPTAQIIRLVK